MGIASFRILLELCGVGSGAGMAELSPALDKMLVILIKGTAEEQVWLSREVTGMMCCFLSSLNFCDGRVPLTEADLRSDSGMQTVLPRGISVHGSR